MDLDRVEEERIWGESSVFRCSLPLRTLLRNFPRFLGMSTFAPQLALSGDREFARLSAVSKDFVFADKQEAPVVNPESEPAGGPRHAFDRASGGPSIFVHQGS